MVIAASLKDQLDANVQELEQTLSGITEEKASKAPAQGEWCVKEVLSHLTGSDSQTFYQGLQRFLAEDNPDLGVTPGDSYLTRNRESLTVDQLIAGVTSQYRDVSGWIAGLTDEQLARKAHMPAFKETPIGEYPTLQLWIGAIINFHFTAHLQQLRALCA